MLLAIPVLASMRPTLAVLAYEPHSSPAESQARTRRAARDVLVECRDGPHGFVLTGIDAHQLGERAERDPDRSGADRDIAGEAVDGDRPPPLARPRVNPDHCLVRLVGDPCCALADDNRARIDPHRHICNELVRLRIDDADRVGGDRGETAGAALDRQSEDRPDGCKHEDGRTGHQPPRRPLRRLDGFDEAERRACRVHELTRRAVAPAGVLGERAGEDGVELARELGAGLARRRRLLVHVGPEEGDVGCPRKRRLAGQALVEDTAERVEVGAGVDLVPRDLLRRDVLERADDVAGGGHTAQRAGALGQAEVGEITVLLAAGARDQDVRWLHVTVDEPLLVGRVQRLRDLLEQGDRASWVECAFLREQVSQIGAVDVAHGQEERAVLFPSVEDRDDVRVVERGRNA